MLEGTEDQIINYLREIDRLHFDFGKSPMTDTEYDLLKNEIKLKYPNNTYFNEVGFKSVVKYKTVKLPFVMGGLDEYRIDTIEKWASKYNDKLVGSDKLDGNSIMCTWENTSLTLSVKRNDDEEGQDILEKAIYFVPKIPIKEKVTLRGEVVLEGDLHEHFGFKNRRNGVTGLLRRDNIKPEDLKLLSVIFYEVIESTENLKTELERFNYIKDVLKLRIPSIFYVDSNEKDLGNILSKQLMIYKSNSNYDIDGLVLTPNNSIRENVKYPKNKIKFKVNQLSVKCKCLGIEWNVSRTGLLNPVILIEPTEILGVTVSRVSGFNLENILTNRIGKGSIIGVVRSGDVIPYVTEVYEQVTPDIPEICPSCGGIVLIKRQNIETTVLGIPLKRSIRLLVCNNPYCNSQVVKKITYFLRTMGMEHVSDKTIEKLCIKNIEEIYGLTEEYIKNIPGFGEKKAKIIKDELSKTLKVKPENFLAALGIPLIGKDLSKELCSKFTIDELFELKDPGIINGKIVGHIDENMTLNSYEKIENFGEARAKSLIDNLGQYKWLYEFLKSQGLEFMINENSNKSDSLKNMIFTLTGDGPIKRDEIKKIIESKGGVVKGIGKSSNYLVTSDFNSTRDKMKKAEKFKVPVISYEELFNKFLND